jgi:hypothetical protein
LKIPTGHLRLLQDPRSDAVAPKLQQWWIEETPGFGQYPLLCDVQNSKFLPRAENGEWVDVPTVY